MNIVRRDPFESPFLQMNRLFNQIVGDGPREGGFGTLDEGLLPIDVIDNDQGLVVKASVPGFKPEDIDVEVHNGILTIKAEKSEDQEEKNERYLRRERRYGMVSRSIALPTMVDEGNVDADLNEGVLTLRIPKSQEAMPRKVKIGQRAHTGQQVESPTRPGSGPSNKR